MTTADLPVFLFMPFIFLVISYWMVVPTLGFNIFVLILFIALLSVVTGQGMGQLVGSAFGDVRIGQAVATVVVLFLMLLGGFFAQNLPGPLRLPLCIRVERCPRGHFSGASSLRRLGGPRS